MAILAPSLNKRSLPRRQSCKSECLVSVLAPWSPSSQKSFWLRKNVPSLDFKSETRTRDARHLPGAFSASHERLSITDKTSLLKHLHLVPTPMRNSPGISTPFGPSNWLNWRSISAQACSRWASPTFFDRSSKKGGFLQPSDHLSGG